MFTQEELDLMREADDEIEEEFESGEAKLKVSELSLSNKLDKEIEKEKTPKLREYDLNNEEERKLYLKERQKRYTKKYVETHRDLVNARRRDYYQRHKEQALEKQRRYRENNREWVNARAREYRAKNRDKINARKRELRRLKSGKPPKKEYEVISDHVQIEQS